MVTGADTAGSSLPPGKTMRGHKCTLSIRVEIRGTSSRQSRKCLVNCRSEQKCRQLARMEGHSSCSASGKAFVVKAVRIVRCGLTNRS
jgi:hypothetical protein